MDDALKDSGYIKFVSFCIAYVEPDHETVLHTADEVVSSDTTLKAFEAEKLSEFLNSLQHGLPIPPEWNGENHPRADFGYSPDDLHPATYSKIPESAIQFVKTTAEVKARKRRDELEGEQRQASVLQRIRRTLDNME